MLFNPRFGIEIGARPPRAQFSAPPRKTSGEHKSFNRSFQHCAQKALREGAHSYVRGGRGPRTLKFGFHPRLALIAVFMLTGALFLHAAEIGAKNTNLIIGLLVPPEEPQAVSLRDGATLGVEQANQSGGPRISLIIRGRTGQWGADGVEAARMVTDDGAQGLIAPPDGAASHLVLQVSGRTAVPVISLSADSSVSQTGVPWMARIVPRTVDEAKKLFADIAASNWMAVIPDGRAGREIARDLKVAANAGGCPLAKMIEVNSSFTNATRLATKILTNHPDAILLWLDPTTSGKLAKSIRIAGFTGALAGPGRLRSADFLTAAGDAAEGLIVTSSVLNQDAVAAFQKFAKSFRERFGRDPDAMAAMSFDAATLLSHILRQTGGRPAHEVFPITFSIAGATGNLAFDSQSNRKVNLELLKLHGWEFIPTGVEAKTEPARP